MIHIITVHYQTSKWIKIQKRYIERNLQHEYKMYAFLNGVPEKYSSDFYYACTEPIELNSGSKEHAVKLNLLADVAAEGGSLEDILIFMDGDAFPVRNISKYIKKKLDASPLVAVQRKENVGNRQPHPCFCATTVGFWREIGGDWKPGYKWESEIGEITDVGGELLRKLDYHNVDWYKLRKSNNQYQHPIHFAVYDNVIYHHGAGFRKPKSHSDYIEGTIVEKTFRWIYKLAKGIEARIEYARNSENYKCIKNYLLSKSSHIDKALKENARMSRMIYRDIIEDENFYKKL